VERAAGPRPARRRIRRIVLAPTRIPSLRSSPWIRTHPHLGFSLPGRTTRSVTSGSRGGRPGPRCGEVHLRLTSWRCHRSSVWGVTMNEPHRSRESPRLAAARNARSRSRSSGRRTGRRRTFSWWRRTGVFELELGHAPPTGEHPDPTDEHEVDEGSQGPRMLHASAVTAEPGIGPHRLAPWPAQVLNERIRGDQQSQSARLNRSRTFTRSSTHLSMCVAVALASR
jgi:hypothetical protein